MGNGLLVMGLDCHGRILDGEKGFVGRLCEFVECVFFLNAMNAFDH